MTCSKCVEKAVKSACLILASEGAETSTNSNGAFTCCLVNAGVSKKKDEYSDCIIVELKDEHIGSRVHFVWLEREVSVPLRAGY